MFTGFSLIGLLPHTPEDLATEHAAIAAGVAKLAADQSLWEEARAALQDQPMRNARDLVGATTKLKDGRVGLLLGELLLRERYSAWLASARIEFSSLESAAASNLETVKIAVRQKLVSIGYIDSAILGTRGGIQPGYILQHPETLAAFTRIAELQVTSTLMEHDRNNDGRIESVRGELEETKRKLMAV